MATRRDTNPQKTVVTSRGRFSPLREIARDALRDFGDFSADAADPAVPMAMVSHANRVLEDIMQHRYWHLYRDKISGSRAVNYYRGLDEKREVPDLIMTSGLTAYYAAQQGSERAGSFAGIYAKTLAGVLWNLFSSDVADSELYSRQVFDKDDQGYLGVGRRLANDVDV